MNDTISPTAGRPKRPTAPPTDAVRRVRLALNNGAGLTQEELAREMGCSVAAVAKMEQGQRLPGSIALRTAFAKVAKRAGVSLEAKAEEVTP